MTLDLFPPRRPPVVDQAPPTLRERAQAMAKKGATNGQVRKALGLRSCEAVVHLLHGSRS
jgi:hypothetical protein